MDLQKIKDMKPSASTFARGLGWLSIGLGLAELIRPRGLARQLGMDGQENILRAYGLREIANGVGILMADDPTPWVWGRVGGDALDLATLTKQLRQDDSHQRHLIWAIVAVAGVTALDLACARSLAEEKQQEERKQWDYSDRSGLPRSVESMRGAARDFEAPKDMLTPEALRPYSTSLQ